MNLIGGSLLVAFFWACITIIDKYVLHTLQTHTIVFIGTLATFVFAGLYCLYHKNSIIEDFENVNYTLIFWISVTTFLSVVTANVLYLELLKHHNTAIVSAITYSAPVLVLIMSMILFKEKLNLYSGIGILLVVCGTILVGVSQ
jgi:uncharacterized membrane protein